MKALVVEDEALTCDYLVGLLQRKFDFSEVARASDGEAALELVRGDEFKLIITDLILPKLDGLKLAREILKREPGQKIIAQSSECDDFTVKEVNRCGIFGFIDKSGMSEASLTEAVEAVLQGRIYMSPNVRKVTDRLAQDPDAYYKILSDRELEVLRLVSKCETDEAIGRQLNISHFTVRRHRLNIMSKLSLRNVAQLMQYALDKGIVKHKGGLDWS